MICMPLASPAMRAATFTVSPKTSPFSSITGPAWKPTRIIRLTPLVTTSAFTSVCMSVAAMNPRSASGKTHISSSPMVLTTRPRWRCVMTCMPISASSINTFASASPSAS